MPIPPRPTSILNTAALEKAWDRDIDPQVGLNKIITAPTDSLAGLQAQTRTLAAALGYAPDKPLPSEADRQALLSLLNGPQLRTLMGNVAVVTQLATIAPTLNAAALELVSGVAANVFHDLAQAIKSHPTPAPVTLDHRGVLTAALGGGSAVQITWEGWVSMVAPANRPNVTWPARLAAAPSSDPTDNPNVVVLDAATAKQALWIVNVVTPKPLNKMAEHMILPVLEKIAMRSNSGALYTLLGYEKSPECYPTPGYSRSSIPPPSGYSRSSIPTQLGALLSLSSLLQRSALIAVSLSGAVGRGELFADPKPTPSPKP